MPTETDQMEGEHPMALVNFIAASVEPKPSILPFHKHKKPLLSNSNSNSNSNLSYYSPHFTVSAQSGGGAGAGGGGRGVTEEESPLSLSSAGSSSPSPTARAQAQLDLLGQLTSSTASSSSTATNSGRESEVGAGGDGGGVGKGTIRDQLLRLVWEQDGDFSIQLGKKNLKKVSAKFLTISQKRNIKRQAYLDQVSQRNDSVFFATIGAFVILPPLVILGVAVLTGYVQLFP